MSDLHEQHELEALKSWWKANGMAIVTGGALAIAAVLGWQSYQSYEKANSEAASAGYETLRTQAEQNNFSSVTTEAKQLLVEHADSPYAVAAAFLLAKHAMEKSDWEDAQAHLRWVLTHSEESHWRSLAVIRLARVLIEANKADESVALLVKESPAMSKSFQGMADYVRGMALMSLNKPVEAEKAFAQAQANDALSTSVRSLSQLWVDDLGQATP
ncbi:MAG: tetratricopeptide repeat protein [Gammaproteobacteria bacterium]|nr:tetratricopeptide repeat protein [Gammaproteobacteria bacterium]